jgi:hypothetical protein
VTAICSIPSISGSTPEGVINSVWDGRRQGVHPRSLEEQSTAYQSNLVSSIAVMTSIYSFIVLIFSTHTKKCDCMGKLRSEIDLSSHLGLALIKCMVLGLDVSIFYKA